LLVVVGVEHRPSAPGGLEPSAREQRRPAALVCRSDQRSLRSGEDFPSLHIDVPPDRRV